MPNTRKAYQTQALIIKELTRSIATASDKFAENVNPLHYYDDLSYVTERLKEIKEFIAN